VGEEKLNRKWYLHLVVLMVCLAFFFAGAGYGSTVNTDLSLSFIIIASGFCLAWWLIRKKYNKFEKQFDNFIEEKQ
jgi:Flp pilus assembly protein TadB